MDVKDIAKKIGLENVAVIRKAEEFIRLCKIRCRQGLGASESCKQIACLGLACRVLGEPFNKEAALKVTKTVDKLYQVAINSLQNILNVRPALSAEQLAKQFGGSAKFAEAVEKTLTKYKTEFIAGLSPLEKGHANFTSHAYLAVAFYLTAKNATTIKLDIDKTKLLAFAEVLEPEFNKIYASMNELCYGVQSKSGDGLNSFLTEKRTREEMESEDGDPEAELPQVEAELFVPGLQKSQKKQKTDDYEEWKQKVLSKPKQEAPKNAWKQSSLYGFVKTYAARSKEDDPADPQTDTPTEPKTDADKPNDPTQSTDTKKPSTKKPKQGKTQSPVKKATPNKQQEPDTQPDGQIKQADEPAQQSDTQQEDKQLDAQPPTTDTNTTYNK